jgi:hypothetical protein
VILFDANYLILLYKEAFIKVKAVDYLSVELLLLFRNQSYSLPHLLIQVYTQLGNCCNNRYKLKLG